MENRKLEIIVTSGGTMSRIDDVRTIGNSSSGTTGALIAEELLRRGAIVNYVYGKDAIRPFRKYLQVNPAKDIGEEIERVKKAYTEFNKYSGNLREFPIVTFEDYFSAVRGLVEKKESRAIVLVAAVSDYSAKKQDGKISSDQDTLTLELHKNPKVISLVKEWDHNIFQVGFKLLSRADFSELVEEAYMHLNKNNSDLVVANTAIDGSLANRKIVLITPNRELIPATMKNLGEVLAEYLCSKLGK
jgi:phosphopantothenate---cysteine ligase (CTP)